MSPSFLPVTKDLRLRDAQYSSWDFRMYHLNGDAITLKRNNTSGYFIQQVLLQIDVFKSLFCSHPRWQKVEREHLHLANLWSRSLFVWPPRGHPAKDYLCSHRSSMNSSMPRRYCWLHHPKIRPVWSFTPLSLVHDRSCLWHTHTLRKSNLAGGWAAVLSSISGPHQSR